MCNLEDCNRPHYAKGLCRHHYDRLRRRETLDEWTPPPTPLCTVTGCQRVHYANGTCKLHYDRHRHHGSIEDPREASRRFEAKVAKTPACWLWVGARNVSGYGRFRAPDGRTVGAHRFAFELWVGRIPHGLHIDHTCGNTSCVNPGHLEPVTQAENNRRAIERTKAA